MTKVVASNRRARFDYEIVETIEAGIILSGQEAKACRAGQIDLSGAYVTFRSGSPVLRQATIQPYKQATVLDSYEPGADRTLLLSKKQCGELKAMSEQDGVTVLPIEVRAGKFIKVVLAVARGRKKADKRRAIRDKEVSRALRRGTEV